MDPREKAKAGVWLLQQAILDTLRARPAEGMQPKQVEDSLGITGLGYELLKGMAERGEVMKEDAHHPRYWLPRGYPATRPNRFTPAEIVSRGGAKRLFR